VVPSAAGEPQINVTPLVDVVLVLLIIFMVIVPLVEKALKVDTPRMEETTDATPPEDDQLLLSIGPGGEVRLNADELGTFTALDDATSARISGAIAKRLERQWPALRNKHPDKADADLPTILYLSVDDDAPYELAVQVLDATKRAGARTIGMLTEPLADAPAPTP
jgi:biopolymer transport protein TolR